MALCQHLCQGVRQGEAVAVVQGIPASTQLDEIL